MSSIAQLLKNARWKAQISQKDLAAKVGLDASYISRVERGEANISLKHVPKLAEALALEPDTIAKAIFESSGKKATYSPGMFDEMLTNRPPVESALSRFSAMPKSVPVVGTMAGGETKLLVSDAGKPAKTDGDMIELPQLSNVFAIRIQSHDFAPTFAFGDILLVGPMGFLPGDPVVVKLRGGGCFLRQVYFEGESLFLKGFTEKQKSPKVNREKVAFIYKVIARFIA